MFVLLEKIGDDRSRQGGGTHMLFKERDHTRLENFQTCAFDTQCLASSIWEELRWHVLTFAPTPFIIIKQSGRYLLKQIKQFHTNSIIWVKLIHGLSINHLFFYYTVIYKPVMISRHLLLVFQLVQKVSCTIIGRILQICLRWMITKKFRFVIWPD